MSTRQSKAKEVFDEDASLCQRTVTPCGWGVNAGMIRMWVACKTV